MYANVQALLNVLALEVCLHLKTVPYVYLIQKGVWLEKE